jgi:hypothetical protein
MKSNVDIVWVNPIFFGAFAKLQKATLAFLMSARPSVCIKLLGALWTDFHEI